MRVALGLWCCLVGIAAQAQEAAAPAGAEVAPESTPQWLLLEIGAVRVSPTRPGTDTTWDGPMPEKRDSGLCKLLIGATATALTVNPIAGAAGNALFCNQQPHQEQRDPRSPDLFVKLVAGRESFYRTRTAVDVLSHVFQDVFVVPVPAIPKSGLRLMVLDDDGDADSELIGEALLSKEQLLSAASADDPMLVLHDDTGGLQRLEVTVRRLKSARSQGSLRVPASTTSAGVPNLPIAAGQVVFIKAAGRYTVGRFEFVEPIDTAGYPNGLGRQYNLPVPAFRAAPLGAAVALIGNSQLAQSVVVGRCVGVVAPYSGHIGVGVNDRKPQDNRGEIEFSVAVYNPRPADWLRPGATLSCPSAPQ